MPVTKLFYCPKAIIISIIATQAGFTEAAQTQAAYRRFSRMARKVGRNLKIRLLSMLNILIILI
jgi:hypothetical protein